MRDNLRGPLPGSVHFYLVGPLRVYLIAIALAAIAPTANSAQDLWQGQSIYQIITDRFFNGDVSNDNADGNYNASAGGSVHGGDFKGIQQKLDYIKALGATAIWISPVVKNANGDYHGYAGSDFYNVDPHWGSLTDLQNLIQAAHAKGLLVIDDVVVNHGSQLLNSGDSGYPNFLAAPGGYSLSYRSSSQQYAPPFDSSSGQSLTQLFHNNGFIQDFTNTNQLTTGFLEGLDDFRTESGYVQTNMAKIYEFWLEKGFDGFRVDTVKHVDHGFWQTWCPQIHSDAANHAAPNFFVFGEVYDSSETKNASYTGTVTGPHFELDSVLDYPLYFSVNSVFALASGNTKQIEDHYHAIDANYDPSAQMRLVTFLDNHDQPRFLNSANANNNLQRLSIALAFLYTSRGIPCLYYGTEQGFNGGADPNNREDMFAGQFEQGPSIGDNFNETHPIFQLTAKLNNFRRLYPALRFGSHINLWNNPTGPGLFAYSRIAGSQEIFVVFNTATVAQSLPERPTAYQPGTVLVNLFNPTDGITVGSDGQLPAISVPGSTAKLYIAQSQLLPLDPVITSISPTHDAKSVPTSSQVVIRFSKPMDQHSVQAAFTTSPATSGTFSWSAQNDQLTYQPTGGLPALSTIDVDIDSSAAAADGTHLYSSFDSRFTTAQQSVTDVTLPTVAITTPADGSKVGGAIGTSTIQGTAWDNIALAKVEVRLDGEDWVTVAEPGASYNGPMPIQWTHPLYPQFYVNGPHTFYARATDTAGNISAIASVNVTFATVPISYEEFIFPFGSAGRGEWDCNNQHVWEGDKPYADTLQYFDYGYIGGSVYNSQNTITGVCQQSEFLYQNERYGSPSSGFTYQFKCPPGIYQVDVNEAETFHNGPNQRRFDIYAQGQKVVQNLDIFLAAGGANLPLTQTFTTPVSNALLEVDFKPVYDSPRASAIHVKKIADIYSDTDGIPDWWRLIYFQHATGLAADQSRAQDDSDGTGMTNYQKYLAGLDPTDPNSVFRILAVQKNANGYGVLIPMAANKTYQLQKTSSLTDPAWANAGTAVQVGFATTNWLYDPSPDTAGASAAYRVIIIQ